MFEYDICVCGNGENCPNKETCERYLIRSRIRGIYTVSLFYTENEECEYYIQVKEGDK